MESETCFFPHFPAELGILYAKYKPAKLMEHLKLFSTRINIPRLIRITEEYAHWKELVFLYVQVRLISLQLNEMRHPVSPNFTNSVGNSSHPTPCIGAG